MNNRTDYAIDIETLSTSRLKLPAIIEIGAVAFNRETGEIEREFHELIELDSALDIGTVDAETLGFWLAQPRGNETINGGYRSPLYYAMIGLEHFLMQGMQRRFWAWGAEFDMRILLATNEAMNDPFDKNVLFYRNIRDARTYCTELAEQFGIILPTQEGSTKHNALEDAKHCARLLSDVYQYLKAFTEPTP